MRGDICHRHHGNCGCSIGSDRRRGVGDETLFDDRHGDGRLGKGKNASNRKESSHDNFLHDVGERRSNLTIWRCCGRVGSR